MTQLTRRHWLQRSALSVAGICSSQLAFADEGTIVHEDLAAAMGRAELSLLFQGRTREQCLDWQKQFQKRLEQLLGESQSPPKWTTSELSRKDFADYTRIELLLHASEGSSVPSLPTYLLLPRRAAGNGAAGVLCVHGHGPFGHDAIAGRYDLPGAQEHIRKLNYDYAIQFARRGYVAVAPCMTPFGRRVDAAAYGGKDPCAVTFVRMQALGRLPITANIRDLRWSIDFLQSRDEVDNERIGCAGLSYGGRMTMMISALDKRIKVAAVSGALNLLQERMTLRHSCGSQMIPGLLRYGDYSEIGSLIAPRPCVWETGSRDGLIVKDWDELFRDRLRKAYGAWGAADQLHFDRFEGGHEWSGRIAFPLFEEVL